jgi:hypothetical protein
MDRVNVQWSNTCKAQGGSACSAARRIENFETSPPTTRHWVFAVDGVCQLAEAGHRERHCQKNDCPRHGMKCSLEGANGVR